MAAAAAATAAALPSPPSSLEGPFGANALVAGLHELRLKRQLCDVILVCGTERLPAHQVVLAAMSDRLREHFTNCCPEANGNTGPDGLEPLMESAPQPIELQLTGVTSADAVKAMLDHMYASSSDSNEELPEKLVPDILQLTAAFDVPGLKERCSAHGHNDQQSSVLVQGLRNLRKKALLCDMLITAGGHPAPAHQAVMAAVSFSLRKYLIESDKDTSVQDLAPRLLELELCGVFDPEAVNIMLDHIYGDDSCNQDAFKLPVDAPGREVIRLASGFELPQLRERWVEWLTSNVSEDNYADCIAACDEFGLSALRAKIGVRHPSRDLRIASTARNISTSTGAPAQRSLTSERFGSTNQPNSCKEHSLGETATSTGATSQKSLTSEVLGNSSQPNSGEEHGPGETALTSEAEYIQSLSQMRIAGFADANVPADDGISVEPRSRKETKIYARLREMFELRPIWLQDPLLRMLPPCDNSVLMRLMPAVAYCWSDGPWQGAYSRLGWDPREHPDQSKWLQVLTFRDPFFRQLGTAKKGAREETSDCYFRKPPCKRSQPYQFIDINDDWVQEILCSSPLLDDCSKREGWLPEDVLDGVRQRLEVKSQLMRDRAAARAAVQRPQKRMRIGGG